MVIDVTNTNVGNRSMSYRRTLHYKVHKIYVNTKHEFERQ